MPEVPGGAARGLVFTTAKSGFFDGKSSGFIGVFDGGWSKNSQKHLPVSKVGLTFAKSSHPSSSHWRQSCLSFVDFNCRCSLI